MTDLNWKPDPQKAAELVARHERDIEVQQLVVDRMAELLDAEERELIDRQRKLQGLREALSRHGVEVSG